MFRFGIVFIICCLLKCTLVLNNDLNRTCFYKTKGESMNTKSCTGEFIVPHCIPNKEHQEVDVCVQWKWITPGYCPFYDSTSNAIKEEQCSHYCLRRDDLKYICICSSKYAENASCKSTCRDDFKSYDNVFCEQDVFSTVTGYWFVQTTLSTTQKSVTYDKENRTDVNEERDTDLGSALEIAFGVLITIILMVVTVFLLIKYGKIFEYCRKADIEGHPHEVKKLLENKEEEKKKDKESESNDHGKKKVSVEFGEREWSSSTQSTVTKKDEYQRNEAGKKDVKLYSKGGSLILEQVIFTSAQTSKRNINQEDSINSKNGNKMSDCFAAGSDKEGSDYSGYKSDEKGNEIVTIPEDTGGSVDSIQNTHSHENKNTAGSSIDLTEASVHHDRNLDACKPNPVSFVGTEDDKDETSLSEEEDTGGVFDDTLNSIKRKDDEEKGGSQDLQDFLEEVSTRLTKKILYHILKCHVTNPLSYLNDESKIALVKELIPAEYQASVSIDSNDKKSISVIYAILQLSLKEKPKSGWGQGVRDRDIGVGDDVERLYRVHGLYREIANPEQVSLAGYTSLFKVLFEAVKRLDVKGQCKEDYQEFVKKWENLQRNQWYRDNLKALQSLIKKWSIT